MSVVWIEESVVLALNGQELIADDPSCIVTILKLAEGSLSETEFAGWIRANTNPS